MKCCRQCGEQKETIDFQKNRAVCKSCRKIQQTIWRRENQNQINQVQKQWSQQNRELSNQIKKAWNDRNPEKVRESHRQWTENNRDKARANCSARRRKVRQQMPAWANIQKITEIYLNCPIGYHVDHIIPLQGKYVSGLHVDYNLQYLPASENIKKGNKFEIDS